MKIQEIKEELIWEDSDLSLTILEGTTSLQIVLKGKGGKIIKDVDVIAKKGVQKAGIIGSFALDHLKRYKNFKTSSNRTIQFFARDYHEKRAYEKIVKSLTKGKEYKVIKSFPYPSGGRSWELKRVK